MTLTESKDLEAMCLEDLVGFLIIYEQLL